MLFSHKYAPRVWEELSFNPRVTHALQRYAEENDNHLIIYGPPGSGKYTRAIMYINQVYEKDCLHHAQFEIVKKEKSQVAYLKGLCHIEIFPTGSLKDDTIIYEEVIKELSTFVNIYNQKYHTVIIHQADNVNLKVFYALRVLMEKALKTVRFIFLVQRINKIPDAIKSRCVAIRNPAPTVENITQICQNIIKQECDIKCFFNPQIIKQYNHNLKDILLHLQISDTKQVLFKYITKPPKDGKQLEVFRQTLYDTYLTNITPTDIIKQILFYLFNKNKHEFNEKTVELISDIAKIEHDMQMGNEKLIYLEAVFWRIWRG